MAQAAELPGYAPMLEDYHRAFEPELRAMIGALPIGGGDQVLEVACGDGVYARWLAERVGPTSVVVAMDLSHAYLDLAQERTRRSPIGGRVRFLTADLDRLPCDEGAFDLVWCAQSLFSFPDPVEAVRKMREAVRPGGVVAVLENDSLHHILLPWPVEVELAVKRAELRAFIDESNAPRKFYVGRQLCQVFRKAGLERCRNRTWASDRQAPLGPDERGFLEKYLRDLKERVSPYLESTAREKFDRLVEPGSEDYLLDEPDLSVTCLDHVVQGVKPEGG